MRHNGAREVSLKAILFADLADYSRLVARDEKGVLAFMERALGAAATLAGGEGELVRTAGDGFILLFRGASAAVGFALAFHRAVGEDPYSPDRPPRFRIGIHLGEVHRTDTDVHGHAVNIAARLEALAPRGGTLVSNAVHREARQLGDCEFIAEGVPVMKNIADRIATFRVVGREEAEDPGAAGEMIRLRSIGRFSVHAPAGELRLPRSVILASILGILVLAADHQETRAKIATLVWPEADAADARAALSRYTRRIGRTLAPVAPEALGEDRQRLRFDPRWVSVDLDELLEEIRAGRIAEPLVEGIDWKTQVLPELDQRGRLLAGWSSVARDKWRRRMAEALEDGLERFEAEEESARRVALALLAMEPGHEPASRALMRHEIARGRRAGALREYGRLAGYLSETFGIEPAPETTALRNSITGQRGAPDAAPARPEPIDRLRIVVGEFRGGAGETAHLSEGFRAELYSNLARFREWTVIEAGPHDRPAPGGDGESGAGYLVDGHFDDREGGSRLTLRLVEAPVQRVVWSETFELTLEGWRALQRDVVGRIAATLEIYVSADRLAHAIAGPAEQRPSFDDWLRGEQLLNRWTPEADDEAQAIFERIIRLDPGFAPAHASLASIHNVRHVIRPGSKRDAEADRAAFDLAQRATELDPMDARNQLTVAWSAALTGAFDQATIHLDLSVTLNPNSPRTAISAAMGYAFFGNAARGVELLDAVLDAVPMLSPYQWCYAAAVRFLVGDYEGAVEATGLSGDKIVDNQGWRAASLARLGRTEEARQAFARLVAMTTPLWSGERPATPERIRDWFTGAYPLRFGRDRAALVEAMRMIG